MSPSRRLRACAAAVPAARAGLSSGTSPSVAEGDAEHRDVFAQRQPQHLEPDLGVHHRDELVARAVPGDVEHGDDDPEVVLEPLLRTEDQQAHPRVQAVRPHHEVEVPPRPAAERHVHAVAVVVDRLAPCRRRRVSTRPSKRLVDGRREIGAGDGDVAIPRRRRTRTARTRRSAARRGRPPGPRGGGTRCASARGRCPSARRRRTRRPRSRPRSRPRRSSGARSTSVG